MNEFSRWIGQWWAGAGRKAKSRKSDGFAFRLKSDATLMYPGLPSACCTSLDVRRMREFMGVEPATRTLVRSSTTGHVVKVQLLKPE
jgi:hypothetical protein